MVDSVSGLKGVSMARSILSLRISAFFILIVLLCVQATGQTFYGSVLGVIADPSGAPIDAARITLLNSDTGVRQSVQSSGSGEYRFVNLVPGTYRLEAEKTGFKRLTRDAIPVTVDAAVRIELGMQVGDVSQSIEVAAAAPLLQTENASLSQVVASRPVQELPLNGRNVLNLVSLSPGVVPQGSSDGNLTGKNVFAAGNYQIGGGTANQSATFYDGVPVNITYGNITALVPSQDSVQEFRVQTSNNTAEYGRYTGGVINMASRAGTNDFHGGVYEFLRNKQLNAANFFANKSGAGRAPFVQNQFGGTVGGPIRKDKTFFFASYEAFRARQGVLFTETVPTLQQRTGDFSDYRNSSGATIPIYDPLTQCGAYSNPACGSGTVQRTQFPGNAIPASRLNPVALKILNLPYYGTPNTAGQSFTNNFNYARNASTGGDNDQFSIRGDHQLSDKQRLLARLTRWTSSNLPVDVYGNGLRAGDPYSPEHFVTTQAVAADTYVFNPNTILDVRAGFTRWFYTRIPGTLGLDGSAALGLPSYYSQIPVLNGLQPSTTIPTVSIASPTVNSIATGLLLGRDDTIALTPTLTWIKGPHTMKFGTELHRNDLNYFQNNSPGGAYSFDNIFTSQNALSSGATGSGFASFLLGLPNNSSLVQTSSFTYTFLYYQGYFFTDTWQVSNKLTLTYGLRWEIPGVYNERYDRQATFNPIEQNPLLTGINVGGKPVLGAFDLVSTPNHPEKGLNPEHYKLFAPRLGVAYRVTDKTVVRTGGGKFFIPSTTAFPQGPYGNPVDYIVNPMVATIDSGVTVLNTLSNPFPQGLLAPPGRNPSYQQALLGGSLGGHADPQFQNYGYTYQWNFTVQHQFPKDIALEAGYAGLRGIHLPLGQQFDQIDPQYLALGAQLKTQVANPFYGKVSVGTLAQPTVQAGQLLLPFPEYTSLSDPANYSGDSTYHSLQMKAEKRFGSGGTMLASYTFSKILANVETLTTWLDSPTGVAGVQNWYNLRAEKALSSFDSRQRLVLSYVYDLPFGKGRNGLTGRLISGWGVNGVTTFQQGFPLGLSASPNVTGLNTGLRPNVVPGCDKEVSGSAQSRINGWFNTACFTVPASYTFGNEGRTDPQLRGPGIANYDMAVFKKTAITERYNLEFRAEAFNLFNRVQFGQPNLQATTAANNTFGVISSQLNQPRLMQLAMRLRF
jgi:Carboxypeptidase regulatory-like domain